MQKKDRQSTEEVLGGRRKDGSKVINKHKKCINRKKRRSRHAQSGTFTVSNLNPTSPHRPFKVNLHGGSLIRMGASAGAIASDVIGASLESCSLQKKLGLLVSWA